MLYETRSIEEQRIIEQKELVISKFEEICKRENAHFNHTLHKVTTGYSIDENAPSVQFVREACNELGVNFVMEASGGASDANIYNEYGVESLVLSVGMREVHTVNEYVYESDIILATNLLLETIKKVR